MKIETVTYDTKTILEIGQLLNNISLKGMDNVYALNCAFNLLYNGAIEKGERETESLNDK